MCNCSSASLRVSGARPAEPSPAMADLLGTYDDLLNKGALHGLAGFLAYESQAAGVARSKADGLRRHYGLDEYAISFWEHHAEVDVRHADWAVSALSEIAGTTQGLGTSLREAARRLVGVPRRAGNQLFKLPEYRSLRQRQAARR